MKETLTYLALGDSYTIGEGVIESERFPNQLVQLLNDAGFSISPPMIIAKTGWTTDELLLAMTDADISSQSFDLITVLIGVNNQFRKYPTSTYSSELRTILQKAMGIVNGQAKQVIVISIPNWGVTPFAATTGRSVSEITTEIQIVNGIAKDIAQDLGCPYVDISTLYETEGHLPENLSTDDLHPSGVMYAKWARQIAGTIRKIRAIKKATLEE